MAASKDRYQSRHNVHHKTYDEDTEENHADVCRTLKLRVLCQLDGMVDTHLHDAMFFQIILLQYFADEVYEVGYKD